MVEDGDVDAIQNATSEAISYQAEVQVDSINKARKRREVNQGNH